MSKVKTPQEKKRRSYEHDRRNTYGENQKSSRKNIPRSKQLLHQDERRSVRQVLIAAQGSIADEVADEAQSQALGKGRAKKLKAFRKSPDRPLGEVVKRRLRRRAGMSDALRCPVCSCAHFLCTLRARPRVQRAPGIPCALCVSRG